MRNHPKNRYADPRVIGGGEKFDKYQYRASYNLNKKNNVDNIFRCRYRPGYNGIMALKLF